jgi:Ca-activated chloride channel family protein
MRRALGWVMLVPVMLAIVSAAPQASPDDLVRQGNAAFGREEYDQALKWYEQAEERITDPGLVAFNEGTALYRAGRFREAELHYRRALDGAKGARRARALYDLGNCLLQQAANRDVKGLEAAIDSFGACAGDPEADAPLRANAVHNLELARLLWLEARKAAKDAPSPKDEDGGEGASAGDKNDQRLRGGDPGTQEARPDARGQAGMQPQPDGGQKPIETTQQTPGKGNLPTLPDRDELVPLAPEDVTAYLQQAAARILRERRDYRQGAAPAVPGVKDW